MKGYLNNPQIKYVLFHLGFSIKITREISRYFIFCTEKDEINRYENKIIFLLSDKPLLFDDQKVIDKIPVLFPVLEQNHYFSFFGSNLVFSHDLLKSAFYLLSGYQEYKSPYRDRLDRFPYEKSIQSKLDIIQTPVVNYYFDFIFQGLHAFGERHNFRPEKIKLFEHFAFFLTHDIDLVDKYDKYFVLYKIKELLGMANSSHPWSYNFNVFIKGTIMLFKPKEKRENPYWCFDMMDEMAKESGLHSTYFFLNAERKHVDSYYNFEDDRISNLIKSLDHKGSEVGLHGTVGSATNLNTLVNQKNRLEKATGIKIVGIRQHRLTFEIPETFNLQKDAGLKYDTSLGFAGHEGFRNSYCLPYKLYDFEKDRMIDHWEIPLLVMDTTLFSYRKLPFEKILHSIHYLISETKKFNGIFTLLWHNSSLDDDEISGVTNLYNQLLKDIAKENPESLLGKDILKTIVQTEQTLYSE